MGLSSKKQTVKPVYGTQIEGAASTLNSAYQANAPKVQGISDTLTGLVPGMAEKYKAGNPTLNAAGDYITRTVNSPTYNPNLDKWSADLQGANGPNANLDSWLAPVMSAGGSNPNLDKWSAELQGVNGPNTNLDSWLAPVLNAGGSNPNLDGWVSQQQDSTSNALGAKLAKMGLNPGGSTYQGLQARELGKVALGARMDDWTASQARQARAAEVALGVRTADYNATQDRASQLAARTFDARNADFNATQAYQARGAEVALGARIADYNAAQDRASQSAARTFDARNADWNAAQARQAQAASLAPGISGAETASIAPMLATAQLGANLPMDAAMGYAQGTGGLLGQYTNTKQTPSVMDSIGKAVQTGAMVFSDSRLKQDVRKVGRTDGGLNIYTYRYKGGDQVHMGVLAQEVERQQPQAAGPMVGGYRTVNLLEVR